MVSKLRCLLLFSSFVFCSVVSGQNIKGHYVSKSQPDGTIYHTMPVALFENSMSSDLIYDLTYKQHSGQVTLNFTYEMAQPLSADSVCFVSGSTVVSGAVQKMYVEPNQNKWKHRYTFTTEIAPFYLFYNEKTLPCVTIYANGKSYVYKVKRSAWRNYAPIGFKIFEMIRFNETN